MKILHARNRAINRRRRYTSWMNQGLICLFVTMLILPTISMAELQQSIVLKTVNKPLKTVLEEIRLQTKVELIGDTYSLRDALPVTIDVKNTDLTKVLKDISKEQPVDITFHNNTIIVRNKAKSNILSISDKDQEGIVKGFVIDSLSGERLSGVNVALLSNKIGGVTNGSGSFSIHYKSASDAILVTCVGYRTRSIPIRSLFKNSVIKLVQISNQIQETVIQHKNTQNVTIDLNRKRHMNLGQILDGSVPGVVLKPKISTKKEIIISNAGSASTGRFNSEREKFEYMKSIRSAVVDRYQTYEDYERDLLMNWSQFINRGDAMALNQETTLGGIEIESRGGAVFPGSTKGMLILIDGFPQADFPANMPMSNVESVEVIRDPEECIKYGQAGINGVVLIKTMAGKAGKPEIRFSSNIFLAQRPDISLNALELASSTQLLDFYDEQYQKKIFPFSFDDFPTNNVPYAYSLLYDRLKSKVTEEVFQSKWDSLKTINNRGQLQSLYQRRFMQQYNLGVSGSGKGVLFNANALHSRQKQETRGNENALLDLNSNTQFSFFKNKVEGNVFVRYKTGETRTPKTSGTIRAPYQLLFDVNGNYIYDYSDTFREDLNADYLSKGLLDHGRNLYQDQISNFIQNDTKEYFATAKLNYQVSPHLKWMNSFLYQQMDYKGLTFTDMNSSEARQFYNTYTATSRLNPITPWLPLENKGVQTGSRSKTIDARSGIAYDRALSKNHRLQAGISAWMSVVDYKADSTRTFYGMDKFGNGGDTLVIEGKRGSNFYRENISDDNLAMVYQSLDREDRNLKIGAHLTHKYKNFLNSKLVYNGAFIPNFGKIPNYASFTDLYAEVEWDLSKHFKLDNKVFSQIMVRSKNGILRSSEIPARQTTQRILVQEFKSYNLQLLNYYRTNISDIDLNHSKNSLYLSLFDGKINMSGSAYLSNVAKARWSTELGLNAKDMFFEKVDAISTFKLNYSLQDFDSYQSMMMQLSLNQMSPFSPVQPSFLSLDQLPPSVKNQDISMQLGLFADRINLTSRIYNRLTGGVIADTYYAPDPSTGMSTRYMDYAMRSKGVEFLGNFRIIQKRNFGWSADVIVAHNSLTNVKVLELPYVADFTYLISPKVGYSKNAVWSYQWAGLDETGSPTIETPGGERLKVANQSALVYSGVAIAPNTGSINQTFDIYDFYIRTRVNWQTGGVSRKYIPVPSSSYEYNADLSKRWRSPGDEAFTDVPALAQYDTQRQLITQNSTNSIISTDAIRLEEIQVGYFFPQHIVKALRFKDLSTSVQVNNVWFKARNKYGYDPKSISTTGVITPRMPLEFSFTLNATL